MDKASSNRSTTTVPSEDAASTSVNPLLPPLAPHPSLVSHASSSGLVTSSSLLDDADQRYHLVAEEADETFFNEHKVASRSPYKRNRKMGRGAHYYEAFKVCVGIAGECFGSCFLKCLHELRFPNKIDYIIGLNNIMLIHI
jgi:hypothetical protein